MTTLLAYYTTDLAFGNYFYITSSFVCGLPTFCSGLLHFIISVSSVLKASFNCISFMWFTSIFAVEIGIHVAEENGPKV